MNDMSDVYCEHCGTCGYVACCGIESFIREHILDNKPCLNAESMAQEIQWMYTELWGSNDKTHMLMREDTMVRLLKSFINDNDDCWYDHHGYCQAHSLHEKPCPHEETKELLDEAN